MGRERKKQMKGFLKRHSARILEKRLARGEEEALASAQVVLCTTTGAADPDVRRLPTLCARAQVPP